MKYLRAGALVGVGLALTGMLVNCRDPDLSVITGPARELPSDGEQVAIDRCVPGQTLACMGACGAPSTGYQVCAADGRSFGGCVCPPLSEFGAIPSLAARDDGDRRIVSRAPLVAGLPVSSGASTAAGLVGAACSQDADCISGLDCLTADGGALNFSGPAGGYCTVGCANDAACQAIDRGSECIGFAGQNICVRSCASRATPSGVSKCLDRTDVMCVSVAALDQEDPADGPQRGLCLPACQSDAQCGPGLSCDLGNGLCSSERPVGDPVGSSCDGAESCASGLCLTLSSRFEGFCSGFCRFGGPGCGFDGSAAAPGAGCVIAQVPGEGIGDRGFCLELCQTASDCLEPGAVCIGAGQGGTTRVCVVPTAAPPPGPGAPDGAQTGSECSENTDCGAELECLTSDSNPFSTGGGPPGGYCSAVCGPNAPCSNPSAVCVRTAGGSFCLRGCDPTGDASCGRDTAVCDTFPEGDPTLGFCRPQCNSDADCGARVCAANGLCVDGPDGETPAGPAESTTGNSCDAAADCGNGLLCLSVDSDPFLAGGGPPGGYCSAACGASAPCSDPSDVCVRTSGGSFCLRGCDPTGAADCGRDTAVCDTFPDGDPTLGFCLPQCNSDADCDARACAPNGLCVDRPAGECAQDEECPGSQICVANSCVDGPPGCTADPQCDSGECDTQTQTCVEPTPSDCTVDSECAPGTCDVQLGQCVVTPSGCTADLQCGAQLCDISRGLCVDPPGACTSNAECGDQVCDTNVGLCVPPPPGCETDAECGTQLCDFARGVCVDPECFRDDECEEGVCDVISVVCVPAPPIPAGGACSANAQCVGGLCVSGAGGARFCSGSCQFGTSLGCQAYGTDAFCAAPRPAPNEDLGFCLGLCNTAVDCAQTGYECVDLGTDINGHTGACFPPAP